MNDYDSRIQYLEGLARNLLAERQQMMQQHQINQIANAISQRAQHLHKTNPKFMKAIEKHIVRPRVEDLKQLGLSEQEALATTNAELDRELIHYASQGIDPIELAYRAVQAKGWKPDQPTKRSEVQERINEIISKGNQATDEEIDAAISDIDQLNDKKSNGKEYTPSQIEESDDDGLTRIRNSMRTEARKEKAAEAAVQINDVEEKVDEIAGSDLPLKERMSQMEQAYRDAESQ